MSSDHLIRIRTLDPGSGHFHASTDGQLLLLDLDQDQDQTVPLILLYQVLFTIWSLLSAQQGQHRKTRIRIRIWNFSW